MWLSINEETKNLERKITITYNRKIIYALNAILIVLTIILFSYVYIVDFFTTPREVPQGISPVNDFSDVFPESQPDYFAGGLITLFCFVIFNIAVFLARVTIVKNLSSGAIIIRKRDIKTGEPVVYEMSENPVLKFIKYSALGDLVLAIDSIKKRTLIYPTSSISPGTVMHGGNRFKFSKEEAEILAKVMGIPLSKEIGGHSEDFDEIKKS